MKKKDHRPIAQCPVEAIARLIGGRYKSLILWRLSAERIMRFTQLQKAVPCATPKMLTQQLRELEADGFIVRKVFAVVPPRVEYYLSGRGKSLRSVLKAMNKWGEKYLAGEV